jgi:hypothetical protein
MLVSAWLARASPVTVVVVVLAVVVWVVVADCPAPPPPRRRPRPETPAPRRSPRSTRRSARCRTRARDRADQRLQVGRRLLLQPERRAGLSHKELWLQVLGKPSGTNRRIQGKECDIHVLQCDLEIDAVSATSLTCFVEQRGSVELAGTRRSLCMRECMRALFGLRLRSMTVAAPDASGALPPCCDYSARRVLNTYPDLYMIVG